MGKTKEIPMCKRVKKIAKEVKIEEKKDKDYSFDELHELSFDQLEIIKEAKQNIIYELQKQKMIMVGYILHLQETVKHEIGEQKNAEKM